MSCATPCQFFTLENIFTIPLHEVLVSAFLPQNSRRVHQSLTEYGHQEACTRLGWLGFKIYINYGAIEFITSD
ncbi:MAG: hypothetical protein Q7U35_06765 [Methanobacteriaceae archaeon]|nr:hypothetical protein [Methanobacteriaceae archaeon]MDP3033642.1 hypothetical protein [Methanobacteriaceae archaeon]MDP3484706.1 hypothetical protein [Methanobacteriaceae archaeon]MDP3624659.1 hypothetical protein [Methanobacteriaceae archaeon]